MTDEEWTSRGWQRFGAGLALLWLAFPVVALATSHPSAGHIALGVAGLLAFGFVYVYWGVQPDWDPGMAYEVLAILALVAIATVLTLFERTDWALLFPFAGVVLAMRTPARHALGWLLVLAVYAGGVTAAAGAEDVAALSYAATTLGVGLLMMSLRRLLITNAMLRAARAELAERAVAEERERFSRDLHDLLGHSLSLVALKAELAGRLLPARPNEARAQVGEIEAVARAALAEVRDAVGGYRRPTLAGEVAGARMALAAAGIAAEVDVPEAALPPDAEAVLAWAVREGTTNVIRHSGARSVRIVVQGGTAEVADDGRGGAAGRGHGLVGLRERVERLGGRLEAGPRPEGGFGLRVTVPVNP
jgi:two-component system, NarL family, sensor histidine kinase DesK